MQIKVKKLKENAKLPTHGHPGDAGMDFYATENVIFPPGKQMKIGTGVAVEIPEGYVGFSLLRTLNWFPNELYISVCECNSISPESTSIR